ncbi:hypothetical protein BH20CHL3_BH20CHL3_12830 [soil metagenome]
MTDTQETSGLSEERLEILRLVENQTVTAEEAGRLLEALDRSDRSRASYQETVPFAPSPPAGLAPPGSAGGNVRIRITDLSSNKAKINLVLPYRLVDSGIKLARRFAPGHLLDSRDIRRSIEGGFSGPLLDLVDGEQRIEIIVESQYERDVEMRHESGRHQRGEGT